MVALIRPAPAVVAVIGWAPKKEGCFGGVVESFASTERWCRRSDWPD